LLRGVVGIVATKVRLFSNQTNFLSKNLHEKVIFYIKSMILMQKNIPPKAVIFSDYCCIFGMSLMILLVLICSTKVSENSDMAKS